MKSQNGIFIAATDEQLADIWEACAAHGFPLDQSGILSLLMLVVNEEDEEDEEEEIKPPDPVDMVLNHFTNNPRQAEALRDAGAKLFQKLFIKPK